MKEELLNIIIRDLLGAVVPEDVVSFSGTTILLGGRVITPGELSTLAAEARMISDTRLWKMLSETLRSQAQVRMFEKSTTFEDVVGGKWMLYNRDVEEKIVNTIIQSASTIAPDILFTPSVV